MHLVEYNPTSACREKINHVVNIRSMSVHSAAVALCSETREQ